MSMNAERARPITLCKQIFPLKSMAKINLFSLYTACAIG
jgi:hypothetical protein